MNVAAPYRTVDAHAVELGDRLAGYPGIPRVNYIQQYGFRWYFLDVFGNVITTRTLGGRVQVVRETDDCCATGLARPLYLVGDPA